jgi:ABC-2 type transport system permease protein
MNRAITISNYVLKVWIRSKTGVFFSLLFPVLLLVVFGAIFGGGGGSSSIGLYVQNFDVQADGKATPLSSAFISAVNASKVILVQEIIPNDVLDPVKYAQDKLGYFGGSPMVMTIPKGFNDKLVNGSTRTRISVTYSTFDVFLSQYGSYMNGSQINAVRQGMDMMDEVLQRFRRENATVTLIMDLSRTSSSIVQSVVMSIAQAFNFNMIGAERFVQFDVQSLTLKTLNAVDYYIPGYIAAFIMSNGLIGAASSTSEFKRRGVLKRLATTPLTKFEWVVGNVISQTVLGFLLTGVMILTGYVFFHATVLPNALSIILIIAGAVAFSGMGLVLAGVLKDVEAVSAAGNALSFPMMFLSGSYIPLEIMPSYMQTFAQFLPLTYLSNGLRAALVTGDTNSAIMNLAIVLAMGMVMILLGSRLTRWKER